MTDGLRQRLGLPRVGSRWPVAAALGFQSLGSGAALPLFFVLIRLRLDGSSTLAGLLMTVAGVIALPLGLLGGGLADRFSAKAVMVVSNVIRTVGYGLLAGADQPVLLLVSLVVIYASDTAFWGANSVFVSQVAADDTEEWFAFERILKNLGVGLGGLLAGVALAAPLAFLSYVLLLSAALFLVAALTLVPYRGHLTAVAAPAETSRSAALCARILPRLLGGRAFVGLVVFSVYLGLTDYALIIVLPANLESDPAVSWVAGVALTVNAVLVIVIQAPVLAATRTWRRTSRLLAACATYLVAFSVLALIGHVPNLAIVVIVLAATLVLTVGECIHSPAGFGLALALTEGPDANLRMTVYQASWTIAGIGGPLLIGALIDLGYTTAWIVFAALAAAFAILLQRMRHHLSSAADNA